MNNIIFIPEGGSIPAKEKFYETSRVYMDKPYKELVEKDIIDLVNKAKNSISIHSRHKPNRDTYVYLSKRIIDAPTKRKGYRIRVCQFFN